VPDQRTGSFGGELILLVTDRADHPAANRAQRATERIQDMLFQPLARLGRQIGPNGALRVGGEVLTGARSIGHLDLHRSRICAGVRRTNRFPRTSAWWTSRVDPFD
jgi:hypothetical protein